MRDRPRSQANLPVLSLAQAEERAILIALYATRGNVTHSARALGCSVRCLRMKIAAIRTRGEWVVPTRYQWEIRYYPDVDSYDEPEVS